MITFEEFLKNYFFKWTHSLITKTVKVMMDEQKNLAAWECLDQALFTSSHVKAKDMEKGSTDCIVEQVYSDERLTTVQAQRTLIGANVSRKKRKNVVDKLAAQLILQNYLDAQGVMR